MERRNVFLVMLVCMLAFTLVFSGCADTIINVIVEEVPGEECECPEDPGVVPMSYCDLLNWDKISGGEIQISGLNYSRRILNIPAQLKNMPVTTIGSWSLSSQRLISVTLPASITTIMDGAFFGNQLSSINLRNVTSIGNSAFSNNLLTSITIPDTVTDIGGGAFSSNYLTTVVIPDGITNIQWGAFSNNRLTSITIPDSVTDIGGTAFSSNNLASLTIGSGVTDIGWGAFMSNELTSVTIPPNVTQIDVQAFWGNQITSITIGPNVTLGSNAFGDGFEAAYFAEIATGGTFTRVDATSNVWTFTP